MEKSQVFTGSYIVLSMSYSPEQLLWKTCQLSLFEGLEQYLDRYPRSGMMRNGVLYERVTSEHLIKERDGSALHIPPQCLTADGLLPTPSKTGSEHRTQFKQGGRPLMHMILKGYLPTPQKSDSEMTPVARYNLSLNRKKGQKHQRGLNTVLGEYLTQKEITGNDFRLSPRFVEEMMGFPIGWTELQP